MKTAIAISTLAAGANAFVARTSSCCFHITAAGGASGSVGQLSDGQNRIGGGLPSGEYCIGTNGGITDGNGRGCILTPPTTQFQCDAGATPTTGFSISSSGEVLYNGSDKFVACQTGDNSEFNIYTNPPSGSASGCVDITLDADNCKPQPTTPSCPTTLSGDYQFPHLIIPINSASPNTVYGTSYNGTITSTISSIFNFDVPSGYSGKSCSLIFLFPDQQDLQTSSFSFSGDGKIDFSSLSSVATTSTDYSNAPGVKTDYGVTTVAPGNSYSITTFSCPAGQAVSFELKNAGTTDLNYFQDYNPSPIGLYITTC